MDASKRERGKGIIASLDKKVETTEDMPTVPVERIRFLSKKLEKIEPKTPISLQFVLMMLFPTVWKNISKYANDCYTTGYLRGIEDGKKNALKDLEDDRK